MDMKTCMAHTRAVRSMFYQRGQGGKPCPQIPGISPEMAQEDVLLLTLAWTLRNYPNVQYSQEDVDAVQAFMIDLVEAWQAGAKERVNSGR